MRLIGILIFGVQLHVDHYVYLQTQRKPQDQNGTVPLALKVGTASSDGNRTRSKWFIVWIRFSRLITDLARFVEKTSAPDLREIAKALIE
jgi:hypothetical protein